MAQYFWQPQESDIGQEPSNLGYTDRWVTGPDLSVHDLDAIESAFGSARDVIADAGYDRALALRSEDSGRRAISFDSFDGVAIPQDATTVEIYVEQLLLGASTGNGSLLCRGAEGETGYAGNIRRSGDSPRIIEYKNGDFSVLASSSSSESFELVACRFRVSGDELQIKSWDVGDEDEPSDWVTTTAGSIPDGGWIGYLKFGGDSSFAHIWITAIGIGTDGDSAPTEPLDDGLGAEVQGTKHEAQRTFQSGALTVGTALAAQAADFGAQARAGSLQTGAISPVELSGQSVGRSALLGIGAVRAGAVTQGEAVGREAVIAAGAARVGAVIQGEAVGREAVIAAGAVQALAGVVPTVLQGRSVQAAAEWGRGGLAAGQVFSASLQGQMVQVLRAVVPGGLRVGVGAQAPVVDWHAALAPASERVGVRFEGGGLHYGLLLRSSPVFTGAYLGQPVLDPRLIAEVERRRMASETTSRRMASETTSRRMVFEHNTTGMRRADG